MTCDKNKQLGKLVGGTKLLQKFGRCVYRGRQQRTCILKERDQFRNDQKWEKIIKQE